MMSSLTTRCAQTAARSDGSVLGTLGPVTLTGLPVVAYRFTVNAVPLIQGYRPPRDIDQVFGDRPARSMLPEWRTEVEGIGPIKFLGALGDRHRPSAPMRMRDS